MQYIIPISIVICTQVHYYVSVEVILLVRFCSVCQCSYYQLY